MDKGIYFHRVTKNFTRIRSPMSAIRAPSQGRHQTNYFDEEPRDHPWCPEGVWLGKMV